MKHLLRSLGMLFLLLPLTPLRADSPMFRANPAHTGVYDAVGVPKFSAVKWKFQAGAGIYSSPAMVNGVVYFGSLDHNFYAVDAKDGSLRWKFKTGSRVTSSPAVEDGVVYFGSYDSHLYALDAATGKLKWKFQTGGERRFAAKHLHGSQPANETMPDPFDFYLSSPVVWHGKVYFGSGDGNIYALDAATGNVAWKFTTGDVVHASPAIADGTLFLGSWDSYFYALDAASGKLKWRFKTGEDPDTHNQVGIQSSAAVADGMVYFGCRDSKLYALDAKTGEKKWDFSNKGSWVIGSPAVDHGRVYFTTSDSGLFYAVDARTGAQIFSLKFLWPMFSSPAVAKDMVYIGSHEGKLLAIDTAAQKQAWVFQTDASKQNGPTYTKPDGAPKYEAAFDDEFYDNMIIGVSRMFSVGPILSSPVVVENVIYVGGSDGYLYALM